MDIIFGIFNFLVLAVYFLFLWGSILNIKDDLFVFDKDPSFLFDFIYVAYSFFNLVLVMKVLRM